MPKDDENVNPDFDFPVDLDTVQTQQGLEMPLPKGQYLCEIKRYRMISKEGKHPTWVLNLEVVDSEDPAMIGMATPIFLSFHPNAMWKVKAFVAAVMGRQASLGGGVKATDYVNKRVVMICGDVREYEGKENTNPSGFNHISRWKWTQKATGAAAAPSTDGSKTKAPAKPGAPVDDDAEIGF